ncbi:MAG TPA: HIT family protein [Acidobacteriota bacterium]|nr:HIT family protein [Acidobacteriota bacterium]
MPSVFTRIINRELPARIFHETDRVIVIADHRPRDAIHLLIIPKEEHRNFIETPPEVLQLLNDTAKFVASKLGLEEHFRLVINNGYGQEIDHVHYHFMSDAGREKLTFLKET